MALFGLRAVWRTLRAFLQSDTDRGEKTESSPRIVVLSCRCMGLFGGLCGMCSIEQT